MFDPIVIDSLTNVDQQEIEQSLRYQRNENATEMRGKLCHSDKMRCRSCPARCGNESGEQTAQNRLVSVGLP